MSDCTKTTSCTKAAPIEISKNYALYQPEKGNYFIGQTPMINKETKYAAVQLRNPSDSCRTLYINAITITNLSGENIGAEFYLRGKLSHGTPVEEISCVNTALCPEPSHMGQIKYSTGNCEVSKYGTAIFSRIAASSSTLVVDGGQMILGKGESLIVSIGDFMPVCLTHGIKLYSAGGSRK
ncbi:MAG: hypothetical protein E7256_11125 [Lachnospiraceae bacterium]|nr:hypothetical protein [Lachnospiraceae bacterium]